ncbi:hypothetical protein COHA_009068 [Chlorella ohadii]|uniref:Uncharacterized protein n=1 Tax=Chlorella ohadii TaxID=2649997 RepID=A0AAD5DIT1_9CHLO|nr:hypothetical protein COHA_009068 [Chlorella ohadii]
MSELKAALAALAGRTAGGTPMSEAATTPKPLTPSALSAHPSWFVPPHLLRLPAVRTAAFAAHDCSRAACANPQDFDCVYRYGLALQELAGRLGSQPADQLSLLHQAAEVYLEASRLTGDRHAAVLYNWAVALTDIACFWNALVSDIAACLLACPRLQTTGRWR